ncbi:hypothetical protein D3C75_172840 [compost metagenome]
MVIRLEPTIPLELGTAVSPTFKATVVTTPLIGARIRVFDRLSFACARAAFDWRSSS